MSKTTTKASSKLGTLNLYNQSISVPTLVSFELKSSLKIGSNNDNTNRINKKGLAFGETYKFLAKLSGSKNHIASTRIVWVIKYMSPSTSRNKFITLKAITVGPEFTLELKDKYKDMAGCEIEVSCYMEARTKKSHSNKYFVHNRFMYFDSGKVLNQVKQRMVYPWMIDQGKSSLCGMACLYYILIQRDKSLYLKTAVELHRTGSYTFNNGYKIEPNSSMYDIKPTDPNYVKMGMNEADWITLASTRSIKSAPTRNGKKQIYDGIEIGKPDQIAAINWMSMLNRMCKEVAGYSSAKSHDLGLVDVGKTIINKRNFSIDKLFEMVKKYKSGKKIIIMIQPKMIDDKKGDRDINSIHWVVYEGGLQFFDGDGRNVAIDSLHIGNVKFDIFTWGYNPKNSPRIISKQGISATNFSTNYYGHIEVK